MSIVLFFCTGNAERSLMSEAFLMLHGGERFDPRSAGLEPKGIYPLTTKVMSEVGIILDGHHSQFLQEFLRKVAVSHVIFVCENAEQSCPRIWPFAGKTLCPSFRDPAVAEGKQLDAFRQVRDEIEQKVIAWLEVASP